MADLRCKLVLFALSAHVFAMGTLVQAGQASREHVVEPGDSLWELARNSGCPLERLREANRLEEGSVLRVGMRVRIPQCLGAQPLPGHGAAEVVVAAGDTLSHLARRYRTTVAALRERNELRNAVIVVGQRLQIPSDATPVRVVAGQSRGRPHDGRLAQPARLTPGRGHHLRRPERSYAAQHVVDHTAAVLHGVAAHHPDLHRVAVGDLSARGGGWISGHRSHQSGRDVDVGLCFRRRPNGYPEEFVVGTRESLDLAATWTLLQGFAGTEAAPGGAERIFLDYEIQGWIYEHAREQGISRGELERVFQYPRGSWAQAGLVRHLRGHDDHLHVRFRCPEDDETCQ